MGYDCPYSSRLNESFGHMKWPADVAAFDSLRKVTECCFVSRGHAIGWGITTVGFGGVLTHLSR